MLDEFWFHVKYGMEHVLDIDAYDHVLFLIVLTIPCLFNNWKRVLILVSTFTLGHTLSLVLASYGVVKISPVLVEFLIPITILTVAIFNIFTAGKSTQNKKIGILFISTLFFGLVHGLGFGREFQMMFGDSEHKLLLLIEFALGIELAQVIVVFMVLFLGYLAQIIFRFSKRDWVMVVSAIVVGLVIPMILNSDFLS